MESGYEEDAESFASTGSTWYAAVRVLVDKSDVLFVPADHILNFDSTKTNFPYSALIRTGVAIKEMWTKLLPS